MDTALITTLGQNILAEVCIMSLSVADGRGPWCAQVGFVHDESLNLYWVSKPDTRHSLAIGNGPTSVAAAILAEWAPDRERALQLEGVAMALEGDQVALEKGLRAKLGKDASQGPGYVERGYKWYRLEPTTIYLLHHDFDYDRQRIR